MLRDARTAGLLLIACALAAPPRAQVAEVSDAGTFSIIARDPATGELGLAVHSKALAVGSRVITIKGGVAVIAHQATSNPMYGALALDLLLAGMTPQQALDIIVRGDAGRDRRQVAILDQQGRTAAWTGPGANDWKGHRCGENYCAQGNILAGAEVVDGMARAFETTAGPLAERVLAALEAGQAAGGDARGMQSAALVIAKPLGGAAGFSDRVIDLRVDDHRAPLVELGRLLRLVRSGQMVSDAAAALGAGQAGEALAKATEACGTSPESDNAWVMLARVHVQAGRKAEALQAIGRAVALNPANRAQLARNPAFQSLAKDPDFLRIVGG